MPESFGSLEMSARLRQDSALMKAHVLLDWEGLRPLLRGLYNREASHGGGDGSPAPGCSASQRFAPGP